MAEALRIVGDLIVTGNAHANTMSVDTASWSNADHIANAAIARSKLAQDTVQLFVVNLANLRVWDAIQTNLPGTAATDDLEFNGGTFATSGPTVQTGDLKAAGATTRYARFIETLGPEYDDAQTLEIRVFAGMITTISDTTATVDFEVYESDGDTTISADLCTTAATSINSLTFANYDFTITATDLVKGDILDVRMAIAVNDGATGTAVIGCVGKIAVRADIKG